MKKIITLLAVIGTFSFQSCTTTNDANYVDNDTISEVIEVTTSFSSTNNYSKVVTFSPALYSSDMVLVYRLSGIYQGRDLWKLVPETFYLANGTLDFGYNYDFTKNDVNIYMYGNNLQTVTDAFRINQVLRIVIVPGRFVNSINKNSYLSVLSTLNIKEGQIQKINF